MAQSVPSGLPGSVQPPRQELPPPQNLPSPVPTPRLTIPETAPPLPSSLPTAKIKVQRIEVFGSTVFSRKQLAKSVAPYIGKELTFEEIFQIREAVNTLYTDAGYVTTGAFIPVQDLSSGIIRIQVVEGELERIEIEGLRHLDKSYIRSRLRRAGSAPVNSKRLENALQLLQSNPIIAHINAELVAGSIPGRSILQVRVKEAPFLHAGLTVDNSQAPSIGSNEVSPFLSDDNFLGFGDRLSGTYGYTSGLRSYDVSYSIPVDAQDGTVNIQ